MTTPIRLPNGSEIEIATDDPKQAAAVAKNIWAKMSAPKASPRPKQPKPVNTAGAAIGNVLDNILPNWGDEVAGAGAWIGAQLGSKDRPNKETAFADGQREFKEEQAAYKAAHPTLSKATAVAGMGLGLALPVGRVAQGASRLARMAHGAAVGAGYGVVSGAGEGNGLAERGTNAIRSGAVGATVGAAGAPIMEGAVRAGRMVRQNVPGVDGAVRRLANVPRAILRRPLIGSGQRAVEQADRTMGREMSRGNIQTGMGQTGPAASPEAIATELERRQSLGVPAIPGDVSEPMRNLTSWASRGMGPGQSRVVQALDARKAAEATRVRQHVIDEFGPVGNPELMVEQHVRAAKDRAAPGYTAAYSEPMVLTPEIEQIMRTPAFRNALPQAVENIQNGMGDPVALGFQLAEDGSIRGVNTLSTEGFDQVIRAMRDSGRAAAGVHPLTGRPIDNTNSVHINGRARDLGQELGNQNEAYRDVTAQYADDMAQRDAFRAGQDVQSLTGSEIAAQGRAMPENAQGAWAIGARTAMADQASQYGAKFPTGDTAATLRKTLGDGAKQDAIGQMTGNTGAVRGLQDRLEAEHRGNILWKEVQGNSRTAGRQALDADMDATAGTRTLSSLSPRRMLDGVIDHFASGANVQFKNDVKARIAQIATEENPATVREFMAAIARQAEQDRSFADLLHRSGLLGTKGYAANIVPQGADPID